MPSKTDKPAYGVLTLTGKDESEMLARLANRAADLGLTLSESVGHTLGDRVVLFTLLEGDRDKLEEFRASCAADFPHLNPTFDVNDFRDVPMDKKEPIPWRLHISSPENNEALRDVANLLKRKDVHILSYRLENSLPARSAGHRAHVQTMTIKVPLRFDRGRFLGELDAIAEKHSFFTATLEPL